MRVQHRFLFWSLAALTAMAVLQQCWMLAATGVKAMPLFVSSAYNGHIAIPLTVWLSLFGFMAAVILLYAFCTLVIYVLTVLLAQRLALKNGGVLYLGLLMWLLAAMLVLLLNQQQFPISIYAQWMGQWLSPRVSQALLCSVAVLLVVATLLALQQGWRNSQHWRPIKRVVVGGLLTLFVVGVSYSWTLGQIQWRFVSDASSAERPNVFIIGIDALRPDHVTEQAMPHLYHFLQNSVYFKQSYTPVARTFVSYSGIFTGLYPRHHGTLFNLQGHYPKSDLSESFAWDLKRAGYTTFFGSDDLQFGEFDHRFGFDAVDGNTASVLNYALSYLDDYSLFNLLANGVIGRWLFPYTYNNRAAATTYEPHRYVERVLQAEDLMGNQRPRFFAVHFCLPHWPFTWSQYGVQRTTPVSVMYQHAVEAADQQFYDYLMGLKQRGLLRHAVVIVLSDHGEALNLADDRLITEAGYRPGKHSQAAVVDKLRLFGGEGEGHALSHSLGHGTDVLAMVQMHHVQAWRLFGFAHTPAAHEVGQRVSALDIKPTLMQLLHLPVSKHADGYSLLGAFYSRSIQQHPYFLFNSGYNPAAIYKPPYDEARMIKQVANLVELNPINGAVQYRQSAVPVLMRSRQHAVWFKHWYLARLPLADAQLITVLVDMDTGLWTDDMHSDLARRAPLAQMESRLRQITK